jgi:hypothetical protein
MEIDLVNYGRGNSLHSANFGPENDNLRHDNTFYWDIFS